MMGMVSICFCDLLQDLCVFFLIWQITRVLTNDLTVSAKKSFRRKLQYYVKHSQQLFWFRINWIGFKIGSHMVEMSFQIKLGLPVHTVGTSGQILFCFAALVTLNWFFFYCLFWFGTFSYVVQIPDKLCNVTSVWTVILCCAVSLLERCWQL